MNEKKGSILIVSLLKPVTDTRMYEKFARTLVTNLPLNVHIAGFAIEGDLPEENAIFFHPLFKFSRLSFARFTAFFKLYQLMRKLKPELIIVNNLDFLPVVTIYSVLFNVPFVFDVRENYMLNIFSTPVFPRIIRWPLGNFVRAVEKISSRFAFGHIVAEKVYLQQLPFLSNNTIVQENKVSEAIIRRFSIKKGPIRLKMVQIKLLYTGTIGLHYGILEAISSKFSRSYSTKIRNLTLGVMERISSFSS